jgi:CRP-like cAMP-binding protein
MPATAILIRKFESIAEMTPAQRDALAGLTGTGKQLQAGDAVVREGDCPSNVTLLITGMLCRSKTLQDGRRQIMSFHTPGDAPDLQSLHLGTMDHTLSAIAPSTIVVIPHATVRALFERHPDVGALCWRDTLIDAAIFRAWMVGIGRRSAYERMAHLLCELLVKMQAVGFARAEACDLPLTQSHLGDALGLSTVHVNRTLQELRRAGLVELRHGQLRAPDWAGLQDAGEFDPRYLQLRIMPGPLRGAAHRTQPLNVCARMKELPD